MGATAALVSRAVADRATSAVRAAGALGVYCILGAWLYSGFDDDFDDVIADFPDALTSMMGGNISDAPGGYIVAAMTDLLAPLVFGVLAVLWGASAIAGEESARTARLLFVQPVSRVRVVLTRAAALDVVVTVAVAVFCVGLGVATALFGPGPSVANLGAMGVHLACFVVAMGMIALAAATATGSKAAGAAAGGTVLAVSYLVNSFVPLSDLEGLEHWTPWYLFNGSEPISNGVDVVDVLLLVIALVGLAVAVWSVDRRDLEPSIVPLDERLPAIGFLARPRLSSIYTKAVSTRTLSVAAAAAGMIVFAVLMGVMFDGVQESIGDITEDLPDAVQNLLGGSDLGTPVGWMNSQMMTLVAPAVFLSIAVGAGTDAIAGERSRATLSLILSTPLTRTRVVVEQALAVVTIVSAVTVATIVGLSAASALGGLDLGFGGIVGASVQLGALALLFGMLGLLLGTRLSRRTAAGATAGLALAAFVAQTLTTSVASLDGFEVLTPWQYYIGNNPLENGLSPGYLVASLALAALAAAASAWSFRGADAA